MTLDLCEFINKHLKFRQAVDYGDEAQELMQLIEIAKTTICRQDDVAREALINVPIPVQIVGDIHGQFFDLQRIFLSMGLPDTKRYLFLGDYVDRGPNSVECISLLLALKICLPDRIYLLRGNHETPIVNRTYGFWEELTRRFDMDIAIKLFKEFNSIFTHFPLSALVRGRVLCMHGGISPKLRTIDDIRKIQLPIDDPPADSLEEDLLWADPDVAVKGFELNKAREASVLFGEDEVERLCEENDLDFIVRAHQLMPNGYGLFSGHRLISIFSAPRYEPDLNNKAAILSIDKHMTIRLMILNPVQAPNLTGAENFKKTFAELATRINSSFKQ
ncbi:Serine/threonine-protein phosphatase [Aphelenchoides bicaudatus]|nr:Serine/threonine-protein phosphatase [Aphelenchoides bicaudatus]